MSSSDQVRTYARAESVVFLKTTERFGGLSNMAGGYPIRVNGIRILTSEALYQACRFPHLPDVQRMIIGENSPMTAKMKSKPHRKDSRSDWDRVRVSVMRWCLRMKLAQNWAKFSELLLQTDDRPIVEESRRDGFWGARAIDDWNLVGMNVLGRLLMELRDAVKSHGCDAFLTLEPPAIPKFLLLGRPIGAVVTPALGARHLAEASTGSASERPRIGQSAQQRSLFDKFDGPAKREEPVSANITVPTPECTPLENLKPYPAMKDSGVPWLGAVPEHWEIRRLKYLLRERDIRSSEGTEQLLRVSQFTGVTERRRADGGDEPDTRAESLVGYKRVEPNDLVVNIMLAWNGSMGVSSFAGIASPAYCVYRFGPSARPWYFHHLLRSPSYKARIKAVSTGVVESRLRLYTDDLYRLQALVPPLPEQAAIVRFLDHADRRIRRYIRAKQKLIKLLEEQKQAIIHRAVTRGLDPNVRLKPSGVEWLGDVPEHWDVARASTVCSFHSAKAHEQFVEPDGEHICVTARFVSTDGRSFRRCTENFSPAQHGDVLMVMSDLPRGRALARAYLVSDDRSYAVNQRVCILRPVRIHPQFLAFVANRHPELLAHDDGFNQTHLPNAAFKIMRLPLPPLAEQALIAELLMSEDLAHTGAVLRAEREVDLLREYRTRLIADVVTGKLDVREAAARLPDETEEPEPLDDIAAEGDTDDTGADDPDEVPEEAEA